MANKGWVEVRVECPDCGEWIYMSWPPGDEGCKLVSHGRCGVFRVERTEAVLKQVKHEVEEQAVKSGPGVPGIRQSGRYVGMRKQKTRANRERRDPGDEEE